MTYGAENWVINKKYKSKIQATEMEYWGRSCRISRIDKVRNEEIRQRMGIKKDTLTLIEEKRLIHKITEWSPIGRRKRGRPRRSWRDEVDESMEKRGIGDEWQDRDGWRRRLREARQRQLLWSQIDFGLIDRQPEDGEEGEEL
ncbi:uncharacterized protein LOC132699629 [Cylas formicarius]|uniref:uncharacterized protein LOC132699629 n=1 Tax=Cylas formicarius TaxID=197179 RepID=UPI002958CEB0|nr:uncharacterized protein LOC132699629 [Cylas formicarius]